MKTLLTALLALSALFVLTSHADQRFETTGGFCHFVLPVGLQGGNDDAETFFANCENSITQLNDGTGQGTTTVTVKYSGDSIPFTESFFSSGAETGINCVMVDSNNTTYVTQDWESSYKVKGAGKQRGGGDDADDRGSGGGKITYTVVCRNAPQQ
jgi:hypothetical protein